MATHHSHAWQALKRGCKRVSYLIFDFSWTAAYPIGEHNDLVVGQVWYRINRRPQQRPIAPAGEHQIAGYDDKAVPKRELDDSVDHRSPYSHGGDLKDSRHSADGHAFIASSGVTDALPVLDSAYLAWTVMLARPFPCGPS